jgi:succinate dehydrogenase/fumarate reductase-like Fe-S protein
MHTFHIYRYDPEAHARYMQVIEMEVGAGDRMLLDVLVRLKSIVPGLSLRRLLPGSHLWLGREHQRRARARLRDHHAVAAEHDRPPAPARIARNSRSVCRHDKYVGSAGLLQAYRFLVDDRDQTSGERLDNLRDSYRLFRCRTILNCTDVCQKGLNPALTVGKIKEKMVRRSV